MSLPKSALALAVSQASFSSPDDGLCSIGHLQLAEDVGDVVAHRLEGQPQLIGDLLIAAAPCHQRQQFALPLAEFWKDPWWDGRPGRCEEAKHAFGNARTEDGLTAGDSADRPQNLRL